MVGPLGSEGSHRAVDTHHFEIGRATFQEVKHSHKVPAIGINKNDDSLINPHSDFRLVTFFAVITA